MRGQDPHWFSRCGGSRSGRRVVPDHICRLDIRTTYRIDDRGVEAAFNGQEQFPKGDWGESLTDDPDKTNLRDAYSAIYLGPLERGCLTGSE